MKALAILRVSTDTQRLDEQKDELMAFIKGQGYDEIIPLEAVGASAIKMDEKYMELVKKVKETILADKDIKAAGVWELSRLGRNEVILMQFKEFFVQNNIQFICKSPYMKLLEDDGSVNGGMELAFSLFATMSKQEMAEKKARFKRTKKANAEKGKYIGGNTRKYGFRINNQGFFEVDPVEGDAVRTIFELYATGKYSTYTLEAELESRGISVPAQHIGRILRCEAYTGKSVEGEFIMNYPPIISKELFEEASKIRENNKLELKRGQRLVLGSKLIRCSTCGASCTSNSHRYSCCRNTANSCPNGSSIRHEVIDELLWRVGHQLHIDYMSNLNMDKAVEYRKEIEVLEQKIKVIDDKMSKSEVKKDRIIESYMDLKIDKKTRDERLSKVADEVEDHLKAKVAIQERIDAISGLLEGLDKDLEYINAVADFSVMEYTEQEKYDIIHRHITKVTFEYKSYGHRDPRTKRPNACEITINTLVGNPYRFLYFPKRYEKHKLYCWDGLKWGVDYLSSERGLPDLIGLPSSE